MPARKSDKSGTAARATALGVALFLAWQYGSALWRLAHRSGAMETKFSRLAVEEYQGYLIGQNLLVLIAYVILGVGAWAVLMPLISALVARAGKWRWLPMIAALFGSSMLHGYFMFRLAHSRPYFTGDAAFGDWYYRLLELPPESVQPAVNGFLFDLLPWLVAAAVVVWWWLRVGKRTRVALAMAPLLALLVAFWPEDRAPVTVSSDDGLPLNVIVIGSDSLRGDRLGYAGYRPARSDGPAAGGVSPFIDEWSKGAMVFERCMTPISSTLESGITTMTSTYPDRHGVRQMFATRAEIAEMEARTTPIARLFAARGYDTAAIGDWCAGYYELTRLGFEDIDVSSFDSFRIYMSQAVFMAHFVVPLYFDNELGYRLFPQIRSFAQFVTPEVVTRRVEERIARQARTDRPFFWHVFYSCNHLPFRSAAPYCTMFSDPAYQGKNATGVDFDIDAFIGSTTLEDKWSALPPHEVAQINALYDGCTRQFDDCFGRIVRALEKNGLAGRTIVVLTSDHGDDLYEPGVTLGHGLSFNGSDPSFHVPLAIRVPGRAGARVAEQVRTLDLAPTLAELTGLERPASWQGVPLADWDSDPEKVRDLPYFGETQFPFIQFRVAGVVRPSLPPMDGLTWIDPGFNHQFVLREEFKDAVIGAKQRCLRTRDWKLVCTPAADGGRHFSLFHTASDPHCMDDLSSERPAVLAAMKTALLTWIEDGAESSIEAIFPEGEPSFPRDTAGF